MTWRHSFDPQRSKNLSLRGYILAKAGRRNEAEQMLRTLESVAREYHERYVPPSDSRSCSQLGQHDLAFQWLENAYEVRDVHLVFLAAHDPKWDDLRGDPRFRVLVERCDFMRTASHIKK